MMQQKTSHGLAVVAAPTPSSAIAAGQKDGSSKNPMQQKTWHPAVVAAQHYPLLLQQIEKLIPAKIGSVSSKNQKRQQLTAARHRRRSPPSSPVEANPRVGCSKSPRRFQHRISLVERVTSDIVAGQWTLRCRTAAPRPRIHGPGSPWPWAQIAAVVFGGATMEEI